MNTDEQINYIQNSLKPQLNVRKNKDGLIIECENNSTYLVNKLSFNAFCFEDLRKLLNSTDLLCYNQVVILTNSFDSECESFLTCNYDKIKIIDYDEAYQLIFKNNILKLEIDKKQISKTEKLKKIFTTVFEKKRAKNYFFAFLFFAITSFFVLFSLFYKIMATILFILFILSFFNFKFKDKLKIDNKSVLF